MLSLKALGEDLSLYLPSFWWLPAILGLPQLVDTSLQSWPVVSQDAVSVSLSVSLLQRTPVTGLGPIATQHYLILTWWHLQRLCWPVRSHSEVLGQDFNISHERTWLIHKIKGQGKRGLGGGFGWSPDVLRGDTASGWWGSQKNRAASLELAGVEWINYTSPELPTSGLFYKVIKYPYC